MGSPDPRSFSRGKRGIAGSLIFTVFDRHVLHNIMDEILYAAKFDDFRNPVAVHEAGGPAVDFNLGLQLRKAVYGDQIPPFDITLTAGNESGNEATMRIYGVEILNEGAGLSTDDIVNESQMTFVARHVTPWVPRSVNAVEELDVTGQTITNPESLTLATRQTFQ